MRERPADTFWPYLVPDPTAVAGGSMMTKSLEGSGSVDSDGLPLLVVDGRVISWEEFGAAVSAHEGSQFCLRLTGRYGDPRI